ncbi:MAG: hypothetical protein VR69_09285 [Peptococcaceae bacterium BRH_c4b]|nr:MAG: hypothetical protein VR69_09285 [Peptococcaceae bacterium BRH_c4b]
MPNENKSGYYNLVKCTNSLSLTQDSTKKCVFTKGKLYSCFKGTQGLFIQATNKKWWFINDSTLSRHFIKYLKNEHDC